MLQNGYQGYGLEGQQPTSPAPAANGVQDGVQGTQEGEGPKYSDINNILDQILNITDQSLDEAQVEIQTKKPSNFEDLQVNEKGNFENVFVTFSNCRLGNTH